MRIRRRSTSDLMIPSLGGATQVNALNSDGTVVYLTGYSVSPRAPSRGGLSRDVGWNDFDNVGLGFIAGKNSEAPIDRSRGLGRQLQRRGGRRVRCGTGGL